MQDNLLRVLKRVVDGIATRGNNELKDLDLTLNQCAVLGYLSSKPNFEAPIKNIEKEFEVSQATMQGTLSRLLKKDFISLSSDVEDKRIKIVKLTEEGLSVWEVADAHRIETEKDLFSDFSEEERQQLKVMLYKLHSKLS